MKSLADMSVRDKLELLCEYARHRNYAFRENGDGYSPCAELLEKLTQHFEALRASRPAATLNPSQQRDEEEHRWPAGPERPAASPLREAAERLVQQIESFLYDPSRYPREPVWQAVAEVRAALAVPALSREELERMLRELMGWGAGVGVSAFGQPCGDTDPLGRANALIAAILDAVCGPEASHG